MHSHLCAHIGRKGHTGNLIVFGERDQGWRWERELKLIFNFYSSWDFLGGLAVKTPCFHFRGHRFDP